MSENGANPSATDDAAAISSLVDDLLWQIDQLPRRGIRNAAGNPYNPSYYKRGLKAAIDAGGIAVADYIRRYVHKPPNDGYRKLEGADSLGLACEALVADESKPYAYLFTEEDRAAARARLAPHVRAIEARKTASIARVDARSSDLPDDVEQLRALAAQRTQPEDAVAINRAILDREADDVVALNRLGRAYETLGSRHDAEKVFRDVLALDPGNAIATQHLRDLARRDPR